MIEQNRLVEGSIGKTLFAFALPFIGAGLLQALYGAVDLFVVGYFCDSSAVSAVAIGSQVMQTITGFIFGIATGGTVMIARYIGAKEEKQAAKTVGNILLLFVMIAAVFTPLFSCFVRQIVALMKTPIEAVISARSYILICSLGIVFIVGYNAVSAIYRGFGNSKTPLIFVAIACVSNIVLDFLFVGQFHMGAGGAALATILAQGISFLLAVWYIRSKGLPVPFSRKDIKLDQVIMKGILIVGLPIALQDALINLSFLAITVIMNTLGVIASAAVGVSERLLGFAFLVPSSFAQAVAAMVGQNIGAGKKERGWKTLWYGVGFSFLFGALALLASNLIPEVLTGIFSKDPLVIKAAGQYIRSYSMDCVLVSFIFNVNSYFSAHEHSGYSFVHSMLATFAVRIPVTYLLSKVTSDSLFIIGFGAPAASLLSVIICTGLLIYMNRKEKEPIGKMV